MKPEKNAISLNVEKKLSIWNPMPNENILQKLRQNEVIFRKIKIEIIYHPQASPKILNEVFQAEGN